MRDKEYGKGAVENVFKFRDTKTPSNLGAKGRKEHEAGA